MSKNISERRGNIYKILIRQEERISRHLSKTRRENNYPNNGKARRENNYLNTGKARRENM